MPKAPPISQLVDELSSLSLSADIARSLIDDSVSSELSVAVERLDRCAKRCVTLLRAIQDPGKNGGS